MRAIARVQEMIAVSLAGLPDRTLSDDLRLLAISDPSVVNSCVVMLFQLGYARPGEWSRLLPGTSP